MNELSLTTKEAASLASLEARVETGLATFVDVALALVEIRERRLYRATHGTFETYCRERWGMAASRARQLIGAAEVVRDLESVTTVTPSSERVARCLAPLTPERRAEVWSAAVETAPGGLVTAAHVEAVKKSLTCDGDKGEQDPWAGCETMEDAEERQLAKILVARRHLHLFKRELEQGLIPASLLAEVQTHAARIKELADEVAETASSKFLSVQNATMASACGHLAAEIKAMAARQMGTSDART